MDWEVLHKSSVVDIIKMPKRVHLSNIFHNTFDSEITCSRKRIFYLYLEITLSQNVQDKSFTGRGRGGRGGGERGGGLAFFFKIMDL